MKIATKKHAKRFVAGGTCTVWEYDLASSKASTAVAEINGRYPLEGWMTNETCDELVYVVSGAGKLLTPEGGGVLTAGDTALIEAGDKFAWEGQQLVVSIPCLPAWRPDQHKFVG